MWLSPEDGEIPTLRPAHAALFRIAAARLSDEVGWNPNATWRPLDVPSFDRLTVGQKQSVLLAIAQALLDPDAEPPDVTAAVAATVDTVHNYLRFLVAEEIESRRSTKLRELLLQAMQQDAYWEEVNDGLGPDEEPEVPPPADSKDMEDWDHFIECLCEDLLEDYDFSMEDEFLDMPPEAAAKLKKNLNIASDYFVAAPDDPVAKELPPIREELRRILNVD